MVSLKPFADARAYGAQVLGLVVGCADLGSEVGVPPRHGLDARSQIFEVARSGLQRREPRHGRVALLLQTLGLRLAALELVADGRELLVPVGDRLLGPGPEGIDAVAEALAIGLACAARVVE